MDPFQYVRHKADGVENHHRPGDGRSCLARRPNWWAGFPGDGESLADQQIHSYCWERGSKEELQHSSERPSSSLSFPLTSSPPSQSSHKSPKEEALERYVVPTCLELAFGVAFKSEQKIDLLNPSMKTSLRRFCALFPWTEYKTGAESCKQGGGHMATELRGLGAQAWLDRDNGYTSLRDIMPQKRKNNYLTLSEIEPAAALYWRSESYEDYGRTPKTPLLGSAMHLWLQSCSVADKNQQQGNIFTRCWLRFTRKNSVPSPIVPPRNTFRFTFADCVGYFPFLKYFDLSHAFNALLNRLRQPPAFVSLRQ
ncbi:hypothetical protein R1flu_015044 [Riccia fluitans]|uniref:Uncharacterized protein n=1 Tax=Riccia fluitans TaxID=41844 RepID=A0ABD1YI44_9MARC